MSKKTAVKKNPVAKIDVSEKSEKYLTSKGYDLLEKIVSPGIENTIFIKALDPALNLVLVTIPSNSSTTTATPTKILSENAEIEIKSIPYQTKKMITKAVTPDAKGVYIENTDGVFFVTANKKGGFDESSYSKGSIEKINNNNILKQENIIAIPIISIDDIKQDSKESIILVDNATSNIYNAMMTICCDRLSDMIELDKKLNEINSLFSESYKLTIGKVSVSSITTHEKALADAITDKKEFDHDLLKDVAQKNIEDINKLIYLSNQIYDNNIKLASMVKDSNQLLENMRRSFPESLKIKS